MPQVTQEHIGTAIVPTAGTLDKGIFDKRHWENFLTIEIEATKTLAAIYRWIDSAVGKIGKENGISPRTRAMHFSLAASTGYRAPRFQSLRMPMSCQM